MATNQRSTNYKSTVKAVKRNALPAGKPSNFSVRVEIDPDDDWDNSTVKITNRIGNTAVYAELHEFQHCCGMVELGGFNISDNTIKADGINEAFDKMLSKIFEELQEGNAVITVMATLIKGAKYDFIRRSFERTGYFAKVKTFKNKNSGNDIEVWVSTN